MRISPTITLGLSMAFGIVAVLAARQFTTSEPGAKPVEVVEAVSEATVPVVVAAADIARGEIVDGVNLTVAQWPQSEAPFGRFDSVEAVGSTEYGARLAMTAISAGQPVLDSRLSPAGMRPSLAGRLEPGFRAYTIRMDDVAGVAGFVLPGDRVDVLFTKDAAPDSKVAQLETEILLQNVEVLGVNLNDDLRSDQPQVFTNATLAVTLDDAQKISVATSSGALSLALRGTRDTEVVSVIMADQPKPAPVQVAARAPVRRLTVPAPRPKFGKVEVILGEVKSDVTVPAGGQQ